MALFLFMHVCVQVPALSGGTTQDFVKEFTSKLLGEDTLEIMQEKLKNKVRIAIN